MGFLDRIALVVVTLCLTGLGSMACSQEEGGPGRYAARGIVEDVNVEGQQVLIDHEDVEGLMSGMTMNFAVPDPEHLRTLKVGQVIDFEIHFTGRSYDVVAFEVVGSAESEPGWERLRDGLVRTSPAPPFDLIDQASQKVTLASFGDRILLVDFIYTSCPGPCPVQTSLQVAVQKRIPESLRRHVQFVSISLDPARDRPEILAQYGSARGVDFSNWSFLTGPTEVVTEVVRSWGVGSVRDSNGDLDHTLIRFLVQNGRVVERYWAAEGTDEKILAGVIFLAEARAAAGRPVR
jgi:protein SCO1/2